MINKPQAPHNHTLLLLTHLVTVPFPADIPDFFLRFASLLSLLKLHFFAIR
jgi:hypothetical protein